MAPIAEAAAAAALALLAALPASARVCDEASSARVPCFRLAGGTSMPQVAMGTGPASYPDCNPFDATCVGQHARFAVESWLHIGGTHIDGASNYHNQISIAEALMGSGVPREEVFITTKCPGAIGFQATIQCAEDNLQMLGQYGTNGVGYIDLLLLHYPWVYTPPCRFNRTLPQCLPLPYVPATKAELQDTWRALEELKRIGVVKSIGVSDFTVQNLQDTLEAATQPIELNQVEWNPKHHDEALLSFCKEHNIQLQAWSPLGGAAGSVLGDPAVLKIAAAHNVSAAQVTLRWSLQRGVAVVVGGANAAHAGDDLKLFGFQLSDEEVQTISSLQPARDRVAHV